MSLPQHGIEFIEEDNPESFTIGAMDMGGASLQIAFSPKEEASSNFMETVELFGKLYNIYTRSYLCYGADEADRRLLASLVEVGKFLHSNCTLHIYF